MDAIRSMAQDFVGSVLLVCLGGWALVSLIGGHWKQVCLAIGGFVLCATFVFMPRGVFHQIGDSGGQVLQSVMQKIGDGFDQ
jgi:uncharacterized membrane protein YccC